MEKARESDRFEHREEGDSAPREKQLHFIEQIIADDEKSGKFGGRVHTRFPPEPNGYLHIGHAKSICLNYAMAQENNGLLTFGSTTPTRPRKGRNMSSRSKTDVRWLGADWQDRLFFASDYFGQIYDYAVDLIKKESLRV